MSREELKKAMLLIKEECKRNYNCDSCMVREFSGEYCQRREPSQWFANKNEKIYLKTIERLKHCGVDVDDEKKVIVVLAIEIDEYRSKIMALEACEQQK